MLDIQSTGDEVINDKAEVLMFYAARVQLVETVIKPALARGQWVIGDRHDLNSGLPGGGAVSIRGCWRRYAMRYSVIFALI